ncbi:related to Orc3p [Lecanosticta acicola]|uniref:Related to Orc3p n=1 Tax=Lecanosticta acicola TaxID=111012 RepID=A0AAI9EAC4_9PEZI|nr:related to Orc3p [Lecanosticta acicola]
MDSDEVQYEVENESQFWAELDSIVASPSSDHEEIDNALRSFLGFTTNFKQEYLQSEYDIARCCYKLQDSSLFQQNQDYVRRQILYCLLQEDDVDTIHLTAAVLLFDGRSNEAAFEMMTEEGAFSRLVELIRDRKDDDFGLHRLLLKLLFEMSRIQKLSRDDLTIVDDSFILYLFQFIEELSDDAEDPYHYPVIRVLLALNEQYMCHANAPPSPDKESGALTNRILKLLSQHGPSYRTFGENLILLLNRESELGPQLMILKLLYLLFTTPPTYEYFYTNDLHVLVDVIIRNLLDLDPGNTDLGLSPEGSDINGQRALIHTYLRVLYPLLKNTQLAHEGTHYKREEVLKLFYLMVNRSSAHFAPVDETVIRLVMRCKQIDWLQEEGDEQGHALKEKLEEKLAEVAPSESTVAKKLLGMSVAEAGVSSLSVVDVSAKVTKEKPVAPAPRRMRKAAKAHGSGKFVQANGSNGDDHLNPLPDNTINSGDGISRDDTQSPFADENAEP